jgi:hypothetical protein
MQVEVMMNVIMMNEEILTLEEAAQFLKVDAHVIGSLLEAEELPGRLIGGQWRTTKRALISYVDSVPIQVACCTPAEGMEGACCQPGTGCC